LHCFLFVNFAFAENLGSRPYAGIDGGANRTDVVVTCKSPYCSGTLRLVYGTIGGADDYYASVRADERSDRAALKSPQVVQAEATLGKFALSELLPAALGRVAGETDAARKERVDTESAKVMTHAPLRFVSPKAVAADTPDPFREARDTVNKYECCCCGWVFVCLRCRFCTEGCCCFCLFFLC
jgi:hypothetical protein